MPEIFIRLGTMEGNTDNSTLQNSSVIIHIINNKSNIMSKFINEFKEFAVKGNAVDMAVGVIIGGAFGKIVSSLVNDIIMPPIGWPQSDAAHQGLGYRAARASHHQLWQLHPDHLRLCHHRTVYIHDGQGHQPPGTQEGRRAGKASHSASALCRRETAYRNPRLAQGQEIDTNPPTGIGGSCTDGSAIYL